MFNLTTSIFSNWLIPLVFAFIVVYGMIKRVPVYDAFVEGATEGLKVSFQIVPYLVVILVGIALMRASGGLDLIATGIGWIIPRSFVPPEVTLLSLLKPLSGGAARGAMLDVFSQYGVDSREGYMASVIQGSTETTFYVLAVYYGAVNIRKTRHTVACGLIGEFTGVAVAIVLAHVMFHPSPTSPSASASATPRDPAAQTSTTGTQALSPTPKAQ